MCFVYIKITKKNFKQVVSSHVNLMKPEWIFLIQHELVYAFACKLRMHIVNRLYF